MDIEALWAIWYFLYYNAQKLRSMVMLSFFLLTCEFSILIFCRNE